MGGEAIRLLLASDRSGAAGRRRGCFDAGVRCVCAWEGGRGVLAQSEAQQCHSSKEGGPSPLVSARLPGPDRANHSPVPHAPRLQTPPAPTPVKRLLDGPVPAARQPLARRGPRPASCGPRQVRGWAPQRHRRQPGGPALEGSPPTLPPPCLRLQAASVSCKHARRAAEQPPGERWRAAPRRHLPLLQRAEQTRGPGGAAADLHSLGSTAAGAWCRAAATAAADRAPIARRGSLRRCGRARCRALRRTRR